MEICLGENGYYCEPDMVDDFRNGKAKRLFYRNLKRVRRKLKRLNSSSATRRILTGLKAWLKCDNCGSRKLIGWGSYRRGVRYFLSKKMREILVTRFRCKRCGATKSRLPRFVTRLRRFADKALRDMVDAKLWLYAGYRKVARWARIGGCSHAQLMREIRKLGPVCREILRGLVLPFSGITCVDEVYFRRVKGIFCFCVNAVDARTGRIVFSETYYVNTVKAMEKFGELHGENITATKTEAIRMFLKDLAGIIKPHAIITDQNASYGELIGEIFPTAKHFLCTFHIIEEIKDKCRVSRGFRRAPEFEAIRKELLAVFEAPTLKEAEDRLDKVLIRKKDYLGNRLETLFDMLEKNRERLFPYLRFGINRTNNPVEHYHGFVKRFQHVSHKFSTLEGLRALMSAFALFYNFAPKLEGPNKGVSPFQNAGWDHKMDMWTYIDYPRCVQRRTAGAI